MKLFKLLTPLAFIITGTASAQTAPNPNEVHIKRITYAGSGCADGTVASDISTDAKAFTLVFSDYLAEVGPGIPAGKNKTKCKLTIDLRVPQGWSYTLFKVEYAGYVDLDWGAHAQQVSKYYFQSNPNEYVSFSSQFDGYISQDYTFGDNIILNDVVWSACGRNRALNIETELSASASQPGAGGLITVDSIDGELTHVYGIKWAYCGN